MIENHIEGLMLTAMNSIKEMIDVNTIIGEPIQAPNNIVVIPISKVSFGFAKTSNEYKKQEKEEQSQYRLPFGGGAGAGVSLNPVAFLVIQSNVVKLLPVDHSTALDKILDYIPDLFERVSSMMNKSMQNRKEQTDKIISSIQKKYDKNKDDVVKETNETEIKEEKNTDENIKETKVETKIEIEDLDDDDE